MLYRSFSACMEWIYYCVAVTSTSCVLRARWIYNKASRSQLLLFWETWCPWKRSQQRRWRDSVVSVSRINKCFHLKMIAHSDHHDNSTDLAFPNSAEGASEFHSRCARRCISMESSHSRRLPVSTRHYLKTPPSRISLRISLFSPTLDWLYSTDLSSFPSPNQIVSRWHWFRILAIMWITWSFESDSGSRHRLRENIMWTTRVFRWLDRVDGETVSEDQLS